MPLNIIIRPNVRHIGILLPVSISTISPQSSCHSAAVCEVLSKSYRQRQKNDVISIFKIADLRLPIGRHYGPSLNCLVFEKIAFMHFGDRQTNKQTDKQMDSTDALSRSRCRERRLNKIYYLRKVLQIVYQPSYCFQRVCLSLCICVCVFQQTKKSSWRDVL